MGDPGSRMDTPESRAGAWGTEQPSWIRSPFQNVPEAIETVFLRRSSPGEKKSADGSYRRRSYCYVTPTSAV